MVLSVKGNSELKDRLNSNTDSGKGSLPLTEGSNRNDDHSCHSDDSPGTESNGYSDNVFASSQMSTSISDVDGKHQQDWEK